MLSARLNAELSEGVRAKEVFCRLVLLMLIELARGAAKRIVKWCDLEAKKRISLIIDRLLGGRSRANKLNCVRLIGI